MIMTTQKYILAILTENNIFKNIYDYNRRYSRARLDFWKIID
jgi:hypothetical protein